MHPQRERREFQRLRLPVVIEGFLGETPVRIVEIGLLSARVRHDLPLTKGSETRLRFRWEAQDLELACVIARTSGTSPGTAFHSGVRLSSELGPAEQRLRHLLASSVTTEIGKRLEKTSEEDRPLDPNVLIRARDAPFLCYRLEQGGWFETRTFLPDQPESGFTIGAGEDKEEVALLRRTYAQSDHEGRQLVRLFAELSVTEKMGVSGL